MTASESPAIRPWTTAELADLAASELIRVIVVRKDGSHRPPVVIGHVRVAGDELVRSLNGAHGAWYRAALVSRSGYVDVGGHRIPVVFIPDHGRESEVDNAFRDRYGDDAGVRAMTGAPARAATLRISPAAEATDPATEKKPQH